MNGRQTASCLARALCIVLGLLAVPPGGTSRADETKAEETSSAAAESTFWQHFKNVPVGPARLDFGGQARLRYEYDGGFTLKGYEPGGHDALLLQLLRLNFDLRLPERLRLFFQFQDAHAFLTRDISAPETGATPADTRGKRRC